MVSFVSFRVGQFTIFMRHATRRGENENDVTSFRAGRVIKVVKES